MSKSRSLNGTEVHFELQSLGKTKGIALVVHSGSLPNKWKIGIVNEHKVTFFFFFNCFQRGTRRNILLQSPWLILFVVPSVISLQFS